MLIFGKVRHSCINKGTFPKLGDAVLSTNQRVCETSVREQSKTATCKFLQTFQYGERKNKPSRGDRHLF